MLTIIQDKLPCKKNQQWVHWLYNATSSCDKCYGIMVSEKLFKRAYMSTVSGLGAILKNNVYVLMCYHVNYPPA